MAMRLNLNDDSQPGTSRSPRPPSAYLRDSDLIIAEKSKRLPEDFRTAFRRMMTSLYDQETVSMVNFIEDTRHALASTFDDLHDEQEALSSTSRKLSTARLQTARPGTSVGRQPPQQAAQPVSGRHGAIAARAQRIATAKQGSRQQREQPAPEAPTGGVASLRPTSGFVRSPSTLSGDRPRTSSSSSRRSTPGSSMDSVTFETELRRPRTAAPPTPPVIGVQSMVPSNRSSETLPVPVVVSTVVTVHTINTDDEYEEEKEEIMKHMSGAHTQIDKERERQKAILRDRQEKKKVKHDQNERTASAMVREASQIEELKLKEKERQEQLIKERLEERKRRKNGSTTFVTVDLEESRAKTVVVKVAESAEIGDTTV